MTRIEWTQSTWNPVTGCTPISSGCEHCYARRMALRLQGRCGYPPEAPPYSRAFDVTLHPSRLGQPLRWRKPREVFVCSMGDLFHQAVPFEFVAAVWGVMAATPHHRYQVLTKRPERMAEWMQWVDEVIAARLDNAPPRKLPWKLWPSDLCVQMARRAEVPQGVLAGYSRFWPLPNVWIGTTVEDQRRADERIPHLLRCPAAGRFLSVEPLLGKVDLEGLLCRYRRAEALGVRVGGRHEWPGVHGVIVGGETGPGARPMHPDWVRSLRDQCGAAGVPFFFKQWGGSNKKRAGRELDGRTHDELPWRTP